MQDIHATAPRIALGENAKLTVKPEEREAVRNFYRRVLECPMTKSGDTVDVFQIGPDFFLGVVYDDSALTLDECRKAVWLELSVTDPEETKRRILAAGVPELPYFDKEHFYFQAPGGQVYRLIASGEDMSKWQGTRCR